VLRLLAPEPREREAAHEIYAEDAVLEFPQSVGWEAPAWRAAWREA
jgi:hypothetical protein